MTDELYIPTSIVMDDVTPHYSNAESEDERERSSGYTKTISFTNSLTHPVVVTDRDGFAILVRNNKLASKTGQFIVYVRYNIPQAVNINANSLLNVDDSELTAELQAIKLALQKELAVRKTSVHQAVNTSFQIAYRVPADTFRKNDNAFHLSQLGLTLSTEKEKRHIVNPDSPQGRELCTHTIAAIPGLNFRIELNDPNTTYGHRFINVLNRLFKVVTTIDKSKPEGVYVYQSDQPVSAELMPTFYPFASADVALGLYRTQEEALSHGNVKATKELEVDNLKHEQKLEQIARERELKAEAHSASLSKLLIDKLSELQDVQKSSVDTFAQMQAKLAAEREDDRKLQHENEARRQKDEWERRSSERKDTTEVLKWGTAIVSGFLTLGVVVVKFSK